MKVSINLAKGFFQSKPIARAGLAVSKYSPEILIGVGVVGIGASLYTMHKATLKAPSVLADNDTALAAIHKANETVDKVAYTEKDYQRDLVIAYSQRGILLAKLYGPSIGLALLSVGCFMGAHGILQKRNLALIAAYKAIDSGFSEYRKRVVTELGEEKDKMFRHGVTMETVSGTETDENGKTKKVTKKVPVYNHDTKSQYARFFDESSPEWQRNATSNLFFLKTQQNYANDLLKTRGHVFLNEVYDMLGIPRSPDGAIVGWVYDPESSEVDNFVDFGIYDPENAPGRDFVNGYNRSILLDFNVDGVIYDLI